VEYIVLPTFAYEHKVFVAPFSRRFPKAKVRHNGLHHWREMQKKAQDLSTAYAGPGCGQHDNAQQYFVTG
jgi:hypothetical protein